MGTRGAIDEAAAAQAKQIRPFRSAAIAATIGFIVGLLGYTNPQAKGIVLLLAMVVAGVACSIIFFVAVLAFQLFRKYVAKYLR